VGDQETGLGTESSQCFKDKLIQEPIGNYLSFFPELTTMDFLSKWLTLHSEIICLAIHLFLWVPFHRHPFCLVTVDESINRFKARSITELV
jgi:hypothetical protein